MAHEIFENRALFVGQPAWHSLGTVVQDAPSTEDAIRLAKMDDLVSVVPSGYWYKGTFHGAEKCAVVRESDGLQVGTCSEDYTPLQTKDAFSWFNPLIASGMVRLEACGVLRKGRRYWILARVVGATIDVTNGDAIEQFVLLANSHDGSLAITAGFTTVRVVCANTLAIALSEASRLLKFRHTKGALVKLENAREAFDVARAQLVKQADAFRFLASKACDDSLFRQYARETFVPNSANDETSSKTLVNKVYPLFTDGRGAELSRGTLWGAFNALTEFNTHERGNNADNRVNNLWFGKGAESNQRALNVALEFAQAA